MDIIITLLCFVFIGVEHRWFCHSGSKGALKAVLQKWLVCHFGHANQANGLKRKAIFWKILI